MKNKILWLAVWALFLGSTSGALAQNITGKITCGGVGVKGIPVSDGDVIVTTDSNGKYSMTSQKRNGYVFYTLPSGYEPQVKDGFSPQIWALLTSTSTSVSEEHNFVLTKRNNDKFRMVVGADTHLAARNQDVQQFSDQFVRRLHDEVADAGSTPIYSSILGDLSWDGYWYSNNYDLSSFMSTLTNVKYPMILFPVMGNHDNNGGQLAGESCDFLASQPFRRIMCPNYYSYNLGKCHFVVLDDIFYRNVANSGETYSTGIVGSRNYHNYITQDQLDWLKKDLAYVDKSTPVFVEFHIPGWSMNTSFVATANLTNHNSTNSTTLLCNLLKDYKTVHFLSGHTHYNFHAYPTAYPNIHENNIAAVCAIWWWSGRLSGRHNCRDGSPGGYEVFDCNGTDIKWQYHSMEDSSNPQFAVYDMNSVKDFYNTNETMKAILAKYTTRLNYGAYANNQLLLNIYNYDPSWKISVKENGTALSFTRKKLEDPLHTLTYDVPYYAISGSYGTDCASCQNFHMFLVQCKTADSPVSIEVTDRFGNVYSQTIQRPLAFTVNKNMLLNDKCLVDLNFKYGGMLNTGTYTSEGMCYHGTAATTANPINGTTYGVTDNASTSYFYLKYNADDALGKAFGKAATWELLFRLDKNEAFSSSTGTGTQKIFSSQQDGGWSLYNYSNTGLGFYYVTTNPSTSAASTLNLLSKKVLQTGKFYHAVATVDNETKKATLYINGEKYAEGTVPDGVFRYPNCGSTLRSSAMWLDLGGDPGGTATPGNAENSNASSFVFARIYDGALSENEAEALYTDDVKYYTEPTKPNTEDMIMDAVFNSSSALDASAYGDSLSRIETRGDITTRYNTDQQRYEMVCSGESQNYLFRALGYDPSITSQMGDAFTFEVYTKSNSTKPSATSCPFSFQQSGGIGFEWAPTGQIKFNCNTYGYEPSANGCGAGYARLASAEGILGTDYTHYVLVYNRINGTSKMYINGNLNSSAGFSNYQCLTFPFGVYQWLGIGGDTRANIGTVCDFPISGTVSIARIWGKALTASDVSLLYSQAQNPEASVTTNAAGYAVACLPFAAVVPEGLTAYALTQQTSNRVTGTLLANAGEVVAYGTPVVLVGEVNTKYSFSPADLTSATLLSPSVNLLEGTLASKPIAAKQVYLLGVDAAGKPVMKLCASGTVQPDQAYLPADGSTSELKYFDNLPNAIKTANVLEHVSNVYYDLQGRKVNKPVRGIYILNGKKVMIK